MCASGNFNRNLDRKLIFILDYSLHKGYLHQFANHQVMYESQLKKEKKVSTFFYSSHGT
ncbi:uncharacterized protein SPAPADRAFT_58592, partial [Spathaspora passalidarum NRRL Y-27907]